MQSAWWRSPAGLAAIAELLTLVCLPAPLNNNSNTNNNTGGTQTELLLNNPLQQNMPPLVLLRRRRSCSSEHVLAEGAFRLYTMIHIDYVLATTSVQMRRSGKHIEIRSACD